MSFWDICYCRKSKFVLLLIILLAFFLRVYNLDVPYYDSDELAHGGLAYDALKQEVSWSYISGFKFVDVYFESIGVLSKIPFIYLFGLNIYSIRLSSVIIGVITVFIFYLFLKELFQNETKALIGAFLLAISPWHTEISRWALQPINVPLFLLLSLLFLFKYAKNKNPVNIYLFAVFTALGCYTYPIFPFTAFSLISLFILIKHKTLFAGDKRVIIHQIIALMILLILMTPFILNINNTMIRTKGENVFNEKFRSGNGLLVFFKNLFWNISPINHFIYKPYNYYVHSPRLNYLVLLPFFLIGLAIFFFKKNYFIIGWLLLASIFPSLTRIGDSINPNRAIALLPAIIIITSEGVYYLLKSNFSTSLSTGSVVEKLESEKIDPSPKGEHATSLLAGGGRFSIDNIKFKKLFFISIIIILLIEMWIYFPVYIYAKYEYKDFPQREAYVEEALDKILTNFSDYDKIIFESCIKSLSWEAIPFLFFSYEKYNSRLKNKKIDVCAHIEECLEQDKVLYLLCSDKNHKNFIILDKVSRRYNSSNVQYAIAIINKSFYTN